MKKIVCVFLSLIMFLEFTLPAFAAQNIGVSSPNFKDAEIISITQMEDGSYVENLSYADGDIAITLIAKPREEGIQKPKIDSENEFPSILTKLLGAYSFSERSYDEQNYGYPGKYVSFFSAKGNSPIRGRSLAFWTESFVFIFIIYTDAASYSGNANGFKPGDIPILFDDWIASIKITELDETQIDKDVSKSVDAALSEYGSVTLGNWFTSNRIFEEERFTTQTGHGWAAERGNNLIDNVAGIFKGQKAIVIGDNNAANGADRIITDFQDDIIQTIQTKYYNTANGSIDACFDKDTGMFRYLDGNGNPMAIEVPSDQYDQAVRRMEEKIRSGKVEGITDPAKAKDIVKKGSVTYKQAQNIAKAGTIESLTYDAAQGSVVFGSSFGLSAVVEFAVSKWNGDSTDVALKRSVYKGLEVGGKAFMTSVLSSQLSKAGLNSLLVPSSEAIVNALGPKAAQVFVNAFRTGGNIYGAAAMKSAAKLLRGNTITSAVSLVIFTVPDVVDAFRGRISGKQLAKNVAETAGGIAGGAGGWAGGAALGSLIFPGAGTVIGGIIGALAGGIGGSAGVGAIADLIAEDDADEMLDIISEEFEKVAVEYLLNEKEMEKVINNLNETIDGNKLKDMYASNDRNKFARNMIEPYAKKIASQRSKIRVPSEEEFQREMIIILEDIYDEMEAVPAGAY